MADGSARIESVDTLKTLKRAMIKFAEAANVALSDADSEGSRTLLWLQNEQLQHWTSQIRKRTDLVSRCEEAVRMKKLFVDSAGRRSSAVDEMKALAKAKAMLEEAQTKYTNTKMWSRKLEKEMQNYRGAAQRFATTVQSSLPVQTARLESSVMKLEAYFNLSAPGQAVSSSAGDGQSSSTAASTLDGGGMTRPADESNPTQTVPATESESQDKSANELPRDGDSLHTSP